MRKTKLNNGINLLPPLLFFLVLIGLIVGPFTLTSQEIPAIENYNRDDYQGGNKNWGFAEDDEGNLYVANTEGILIYNGMNWQKVYLPKQRVPRCIYRGFDGRIYAGGFETIGYIDIKNPGRPEFVDIGKNILEGTEEEIWHITGNEHQLLFQSFAIVLFYDGTTMKLHRPPGTIMFGQWINDKLYIPRIGSGMYVLEGEIEQPINTTTIPDRAVISAIEAYSDSSVVIATRNNGLFLLNNQKITAIQSPFNSQLKSDQINELIRLKNGTYAIGTIKNGVYLTEDLFKIKFHINKTNGLTNNTVLSLYEAKKGALCIGLNVGLDIWRINESDLFYYDVNGMLGTVFTSAYYQNHFFVGTNQGVFVQNEKGRFESVPGSQGQVWSLQVVGEDLLCGHNSGTLQWINGEFIQVSTITGGMHMQPLDNGRLLQSTYNGLVLLEKKNGIWRVVNRISGTDKLVDRFIYRSGDVVGLHPYFGLVYYKLNLAESRMISRKIFSEPEINVGNNTLGLLSNEDKILVRIDTNMFEVTEFGILAPLSTKLQEELNQWGTEELKYRTLKALNNNSEQNRLISYFPNQGTIIYSIEEGYVKKLLGSIYPEKNIPKMSIQYLLVNDQYVENPGKFIQLKPNQQKLTLQLRRPDWFSERAVPYTYRLINFDNFWDPLPDDGQLEFKQLSHGEYNLEIKNADEEAYSILRFTIYPHWYESWPGLLLMLVLGAVIIGLINLRNKKRFKQENLKLQKEKEKALETERIKAKTEKLEHEVTYKSKMLANSAMTMLQKNEILNELKEVIIKESVRSNSVHSLKSKAIKLIERNLNSDESWEIFDRNFSEVHENFLEKFKETYPNITPGDLRLAAYLKMNLSSKEIAPLLQISIRSVENKRYRLRKKMNLSPDTNLSDFLMRF